MIKLPAKNYRYLLAMLSVTGITICAMAGSTTTAPALDSALDRWIQQLNNIDPVVRQSAVRQLMAIGHENLPALHQAMRRLHPLAPQQLASLHRVVIQLVLSDPTTDGGTAGFLGANLSACQLPQSDGQQRQAILIVDCIPGFPAYRQFQNGDIILAINGNPKPTENIPQFQQEILRRSPGTAVKLKVLRDGAAQIINLTLSARPDWTRNGINLPDMMQARQRQAEQYWLKMLQ